MKRALLVIGVTMLVTGSVHADVRKAWIGVNGLT